jgi:hypothetical protein
MKVRKDGKRVVELNRKRGDAARKRRERFTAKLAREFVEKLTQRDQKKLLHLVARRLGISSPEALSERIAELLRHELELRILTLAINPDWIRPEIGEALRPIIQRVFDPKLCNDDCKYMYFCSEKKGHKGLHRDGGLIWD